MKEITARDAQKRFGRLLDAAQNAPVRVTRNGRAVGVVMSMQQFERREGPYQPPNGRQVARALPNPGPHGPVTTNAGRESHAPSKTTKS